MIFLIPSARSCSFLYEAKLNEALEAQLIAFSRDWEAEDSCRGYRANAHELPSADRLSSEANRSTFYPTNITPQDYDFNGGIWLDLENKVRAYAYASDTLYVVTGAKYDSSSAWSGSSRGRAARVPDAYYKVLLRYKKGDPSGEYSAAGFYFPHSASIAGGNFMDYAKTVKEVEAETGEHFFASFASQFGEAQATAIKNADPNVTLSQE